jgi:hypothetical protein
MSRAIVERERDSGQTSFGDAHAQPVRPVTERIRVIRVP